MYVTLFFINIKFKIYSDKLTKWQNMEALEQHSAAISCSLRTSLFHFRTALRAPRPPGTRFGIVRIVNFLFSHCSKLHVHFICIYICMYKSTMGTNKIMGLKLMEIFSIDRYEFMDDNAYEIKNGKKIVTVLSRRPSLIEKKNPRRKRCPFWCA